MAPAIMIAVSRSGNNNPSLHIVTPDRGERPVPATRLAQIASLHPKKRGNVPAEASAGLIHRTFDAKPVPI
jgi:hypothetical protein